MTVRIRCSKCEAESYYSGKTKIYCPTCFAQLEDEKKRLREAMIIALGLIKDEGMFNKKARGRLEKALGGE